MYIDSKREILMIVFFLVQRLPLESRSMSRVLPRFSRAREFPARLSDFGEKHFPN